MLLSYYKRPLLIILLLYSILLLCYFQFYSNIKYDLDGKEGIFCGYIKTYPEYIRNNLKFEFISKSPYNNLKFITYLKKEEDISYMDCICFEGKTNKPYFYSVPGNFNWTKYLFNKGIFFEIRGEKIISIKKAGFPYNLALKIRNKIMSFIDSYFTGDENGVLNGIVIGYKKNVSDKLKLAFQDSGSMHLLVASGSNVGFLMGMFSFVFIQFLKFRKLKALLFSLIFTAFYVLSAGLDPPLTRAYIMTFIGTFFLLIGRRIDLFQILILSAFIILIFSPHSIFDPGFQMSFSAVYGIVIGFLVYDKYFKIKNKFILYFSKLFFITIFAQIALFPLLIIYFYKFSIISVISNMMLVPFSGFLMYLVFISVVLEKINFVFPILISLLKISISIFIKCVYFFGSFKYSAIYLPNFSLLGWFSIIILIFLLLHYPLLNFKKIKVKIIFFILFLSIILSFYLPSKDFKIYFYNCRGVKSGLLSDSNKLFILNPCDKKIINSILYSGYKRVKAVLITDRKAYKKEVLDEISKALNIEKIYIPLWIEKIRGDEIQLWPGEYIKNKDFMLKMVWSGNVGYSGGDFDRIKYIINNRNIVP